MVFIQSIEYLEPTCLIKYHDIQHNSNKLTPELPRWTAFVKKAQEGCILVHPWLQWSTRTSLVSFSRLKRVKARGFTSLWCLTVTVESYSSSCKPSCWPWQTPWRSVQSKLCVAVSEWLAYRNMMCALLQRGSRCPCLKTHGQWWGVLWCSFSAAGSRHFDSLLMTRIKAPFSSFSLWLSDLKSFKTWGSRWGR